VKITDKVRQLTVVVTILITLIVNGLANALPLNGLNTGQISDRFHVYFVPAGYVFSIWGLIYIGLIAFAIFQATPSQRENPRLKAAGWWISLSGLVNSAWIFLWHYLHFSLTVLAMVILLLTLIITYNRLEIGYKQISRAELWCAQIPFSIYLGWISVATVANITDLLDFLQWDGFGLSDETWMVILLVVVFIIVALVNFYKLDLAYTMVVLWALAGISVKHASIPVVVIPTWITFGLVGLSLLVGFLLKNHKRRIGN